MSISIGSDRFTSLSSIVGAVDDVAKVALPILNPPAALVGAVVDAFLPAPAGPVTPPSRPPPPVDPARGLSAEQRTRLNDAASGKNGPSAQAVAKALMAQAQVLPDDLRLKVLNLGSKDLAGPDGENLKKVFASPAWLSGTAEQKRQLMDVASVAGPKGLESLAALAADPARLNDRDKDNRTLLSNLAALSNQELNKEIVDVGNDPDAVNPITRQRLMDGVLQASVDPAGSVRQGSYNTCVPAAMEYELARTNPSEYARLVAGLASKEGSVSTKGGSTLELQSAYLTQFTRGDDRLASSALFQGATMEFANGADEYDEDLDQSFKPHADRSKRGREGLDFDEQARLGSALFGGPYMASRVNDKVINELEKYPSNPPPGTKPVVISFKTDGKLEHACTLKAVVNGRVYFRNPVGSAGQEEINRLAARGWRIEDPASGEWSMSVDDFKKQVGAVTGPK